MKNRATTGGTTEHTREQPRTTEDKQNQKHKRSTPARHQGKNQPNKPKERQEPPTSNNQTNKPKERQEPDQRHTTHETRKPASRHQPPSQVSGAPPLRGEHLKRVELHGGGAELKPGLRPRPRRQVVTRNPNHLHPTDAVARKLAHNAHAKPPAVALREEGARLRLRPRPKPPPLTPRLRLGRKGDGSMDVRRRLTILP